MATKRNELSDLQRDLLQLALQGPKAKIWLPKSYQQSFPTTYAAVVALQKRGLLDAEQGKDPEILTWKVTKEGREALKVPKAQPAPRETASPSPGPKTPAVQAASPRSAPAAKAEAPRQQGTKGKEAAPAKPARSSREKPSPAPAARKSGAGQKTAVAASRGPRSVPAAPQKQPRESGAKGKQAVPAAKSERSAAKKTPAVKKSGGRGRT